MKKKISLLLVLILLSMFAACCSKNEVKIKESLNKEDSRKSVVGEIVMVGNEPFTNLALNVNDSLVYILDCPKEMSDSLKQKQGERFIIYYSDIIKNETGTKLVVKGNKKLDNKMIEGEK